MNQDALIKRLDQIEQQNRRILSLLTQKKEAVQWVKASDVLRLTGWNRHALKRRREEGIVRFKKDGTHWKYDMSSIPAVLIKKLVPENPTV